MKALAGARVACLAYLVLLPARAADSPRTPADERASFRFSDPSLDAELVAAEPDVVSPVAMAWDAAGRLYIAEMNDYPVAPEGGRIRRLEDRDGDGRYETSGIFAEGLHFPASVLPWRDGVLVASAPDILFLRDSDGDGRADERRVVLTGFGEGNQQLRVNSLTWGIDNWVYGANGRSDGEIHLSDGSRLSLRRHDFRFHPDTGEVEVIAGASQFGLAFDSVGNRFLSWNTIPIRHEVIPERSFEGAPATLQAESLQACLPAGDDGAVYPVAPVPATFNRESTRHFNALAGLHIYGGDALGAEYEGSVFMGETLRSLVHRRTLEREGLTFVSRRADPREFLAAEDPWFHPVNFATGPDGSLYIADFYRRWVEHPGYVPEKMRASQDWREGAGRGRIWRIVTKSKARDRRGPVFRLDSSSTEERVAALGSGNSWTRLTAHRLLVEARDPEAVRLLRALGPRNSPVTARVQSLWLLDALGGLDERFWSRRFSDPDARVRSAAVRLADEKLRNPRGLDATAVGWLPSRIAALAGDEDAAVRLQVTLASRRLSRADRLDVLREVSRMDLRDPWMSRAILASCGDASVALATDLVTRRLAGSEAFLFEAGCGIGAQWNATNASLPAVRRRRGGSVGSPGIAVMAGVADGLARSGKSPAAALRGIDAFDEVTAAARAALADSKAVIDTRIHALVLLSLAGEGADAESLLRYLDSEHPAALQLAAADRLIPAANAEASARVLSRWSNYSGVTRGRILTRMARNPLAVPGLIAALERRQVEKVEIDPQSREVLLRQADPGLKGRATEVFAGGVDADRARVVQQFEPALAMRGVVERGAAQFARNCLTCHRVGPRGGQVGPDLSGIGARAPEALIVDILDPSRQLTPDHLAYTVVTRDGENPTGLIVAETGESVTLRRANLPDEMIPRNRIQSIRAEGRSLMPDGLEATMTTADVADLLAFLADPDPRLLPPAAP